MDAPLVRAFLEALPDIVPDESGLPRVRTCLASLQDPDVRYLVAAVVGPEAAAVARVMAAVLTAAGAPTGTVGTTPDALVDGRPIDDALFAAAGTLAASAAYQLHQTRPEMGELTRREATVLTGLVALAEANQRVALLVDEDISPHDPVHAPKPDLTVITRSDGAALDRALGLIPDGRPAVVASLEAAARERVERWATEAGTPLLLGERDHAVSEADGRLTFSVRGEPYVTFDPLPDVAPREIGCGIAGALALGVMGIRMREDWVLGGLDALRGEAVAT